MAADLTADPVYPTQRPPAHDPGPARELKLRFRVLLESYELPEFARPEGPLFHRFLPDGSNDQISLTEEDDPWAIRVWFNREVEMEGGFLRYKRNGKGFDESIMRRQGSIMAGPLRGDVVVPDVSEAERAALLENPKSLTDTFGQDAIENPAHEALGRRVIDRIQPRLTAFINVLRTQYGQYWLRALHPWDSTRSTLGSYCSSTLGLIWWSETHQAWMRFLPTNSGDTMIVQRLPGRGFGEYLTEGDWRALQRAKGGADVSPVLIAIGNATKALDFVDLRQAFVEASTAIELAISSRLSASTATIKRTLNSFEDRTPHRTKVSVILLVLGIEEELIEQVLKMIDIRNRVVHEGYLPVRSEDPCLRASIHAIKRLIGLEIKIPTLSSTNELSPPV